jgi:hypothetical protein
MIYPSDGKETEQEQENKSEKKGATRIATASDCAFR